MSQTGAGYEDFRTPLEIRQIIADIDLKLVDRDRKRQETRFAPILLAMAGATAGGGLLAAGAALFKLFH